jgi:hypothetical protein
VAGNVAQFSECSFMNIRRKLKITKILYLPVVKYREGQVSALNQVQNRAVIFANNINESGWETLAQRRLIAEYAPFSRNTPGDGLG